MSGNWSQFMQNPKALMIKKFMVQILNNKVEAYDDLFTRLAPSLVTDGDFRVFAEMINEVLHAGYLRAVDDYRGELNKLGIDVSLTMPLAPKSLADNRSQPH